MSETTFATVCDIVIPIWNKLALTQRCLDSILESTSEPVRLILIDNGSSPPTEEYLEHFQTQNRLPVTLIRNATNLGFIQATNQGIRASQSPWVCLLNNDTVVTPGWLTEMLRVAQADSSIGLVNPTSNSLGFSPGRLTPGEYAKSLQSQSGQWTELSTALGFCLLARRRLFDRIGLLDESFGMGNFDDDDLSRRVQAKGLRSVRACAAYVFHEEKASFRELAGWEEAFEKNRQRFEERWGRRLRILLGPLRTETATEPGWQKVLLDCTRQGHWLTLLTPSENLSSEILTHAQVSRLPTQGNRWRLQGTVRLLLKRKKPFDLVVSYDATWSGWLRRLRWLYRAQLLETPSEEELLKRCQALSHSL